MKTIKLTQGKVTLVDDEDFEYLNQWKWCATKMGNTFYALRNSPRFNRKRTAIYMARVIMRAEKGQMIDHEDRNGLNNQRENLRIATKAENKINSKIQWNNTSGYKGVHWHNLSSKWQAEIGKNGKRIYLGRYKDKREAATAYNIAARKYYEEFAEKVTT